MSIKSFLEKAGEDLLKVITFGEVAARAAAPFVSVVNPELGALINATVGAAVAAQAAGATAIAGAPSTDTDAQKAALVVAAIEPQAQAFAQSIGAGAPTQAQLLAWNDAIVAALNVFQVSATDAAAPAATPAA